MKYLEIREGFSILKAEIEAIEKVDEFKTLVHTHHNSFESTFPYMTLLQLLESDVDKEEKEDKVLNKLDGFLNEAGTFAG